MFIHFNPVSVCLVEVAESTDYLFDWYIDMMLYDMIWYDMIWHVTYVLWDHLASKWIQEICHKLGIFLLLGGSLWKRKFLDSDVVVHIAYN